MADETTTATTEETPAEAAGPAKEFDAAIKELGDKIVGLTLLQAQQLTEYLKEEYGIEPAAGGGAVMMAPAEGAGGGEAAEEKTEFDVIIKDAGAKKLGVIKVVRAARSDLGLKEAKALVDTLPKPLVEAVAKEEAEKWKKELEDAGATVEIA